MLCHGYTVAPLLKKKGRDMQWYVTGMLLVCVTGMLLVCVTVMALIQKKSFVFQFQGQKKERFYLQQNSKSLQNSWPIKFVLEVEIVEIVGFQDIYWEQKKKEKRKKRTRTRPTAYFHFFHFKQHVPVDYSRVE